MSVTDDALGRITFTHSKLYSDEFVDKLVDKSFEHYTSNCIHSYTEKEEREWEERMKREMEEDEKEWGERRKETRGDIN